jgi:YVTN family beta-propeller protein
MFDLRLFAILGVSLLGLSLSTGSASAYLAYVSNEKGNSISVIDTDKMETIATIKTGQRPRGIEVSRDGKLVYVALGDDDIIQVFDTKTLNNAGELPSGPDPEQFTLDPAGRILYVANENDAMVTVIDLEKRASIGEVSVGIEPEGMTVSPDSKILICTSETTSMVHFIDTASREIVGNLLVGSRPRFSAYKTDGSCDHRSGDTAAQADGDVRDPGSAIRGDPARRHQYHPRWQARLHRSRPGQSGRGGRRRHSHDLEISAGRPKSLARRLYAGRKISAGRQRRLERRLGHRRGGLAGYQIDSGRRIALGRCVRPELKIGDAKLRPPCRAFRGKRPI